MKSTFSICFVCVEMKGMFMRVCMPFNSVCVCVCAYVHVCVCLKQKSPAIRIIQLCSISGICEGTLKKVFIAIRHFSRVYSSIRTTQHHKIPYSLSLSLPVLAQDFQCPFQGKKKALHQLNIGCFSFSSCHAAQLQMMVIQKLRADIVNRFSDQRKTD